MSTSGPRGPLYLEQNIDGRKDTFSLWHLFIKDVDANIEFKSHACGMQLLQLTAEQVAEMEAKCREFVKRQ